MILILNGPSSSGKTTLSHNLQAIWEKPLYYLSYDSVHSRMAPYRWQGKDCPDGSPEVKDFLTVMYACAAAIDTAGRDAVIDNCLFDCEDIYALSQEWLKGHEAFFVRIKIDPEELNRREAARGDRPVGKAAWQLAHIVPKEDAAYDLIVSTDHPSEAVAAEIYRAVFGHDPAV